MIKLKKVETENWTWERGSNVPHYVIASLRCCYQDLSSRR